MARTKITKPAPRKRPVSEVEDTKGAPPSKRVDVKSSSKASETALRRAVKQPRTATPKKNLQGDTKSEIKIKPKTGPKNLPKRVLKAADFEFETDKPTGLPYIYIVLEKTLTNSTKELGEEVLSTFATLTDANNFVRNHCAENAERDDPYALFTEEMSTDGRISWTYEDENRCGTEVRIEKCVINAPGSVPVKDWGRPIGAPCPPEEDSEVESSSDDDDCSCSRCERYSGYH
jgi:hypothetical protein